MVRGNSVTVDVKDVVMYIKDRLSSDNIKIDLDTIETILDLELCFLEETGLIEF